MPEVQLEGYDFAIRRHVKWGEMDAFQHVNNTVYFRWFEDVRIAHFEALGAMKAMAETGIGPILGATSARFRLPLEYPDEVIIGSRIRDVGEDRFLMEYAVQSSAKDALAATGDGRVVFFDYNVGAKAAIPVAVRDAISG
ncbi:MAG: thioesterase family protein [Pseudomonadota bacterium]